MTISSIESMMHVFLCIAHCSEGDQDTGMFSITTVLLITMRKKGGSSCVVLPPLRRPAKHLIAVSWALATPSCSIDAHSTAVQYVPLQWSM